MANRDSASGRVGLAILASVILVAVAPFVGVVRSEIRAAFPGYFAHIVYGAMLVALVVGIVLARVRERRRLRYGLMALAVTVAVVHAWLTGNPDPNVRPVEYFHYVEYGLITFLFFRIWHDRRDLASLAAPALAAFVVGVAEEGYQWFLPARVGELKDVWLNGVAIGCGLLFSLGVQPLDGFRAHWGSGSRLVTQRMAAVAVLALAAFVHVVHLGYEIQTPDAGRFTTRYTADELAELDRTRAAEWKTAPPRVRPPRFSREDQFMTEGLQHVQARNKAWERGAFDAAWRENRILERYFPAVLDTPSGVENTDHRWNTDQRADAETRGGARVEASAASAAYPYPIYTWPPWALWAAALLAALVLWFAGSGVTSSRSTATSSRPV